MKIGLAALAIVAFATSAHANPAENPFAKDEVVLDLRGLDLATAQGQQRLAIRMDQAARAVCGDRVAAVHLAMEAKAQACGESVHVRKHRADILGVLSSGYHAGPQRFRAAATVQHL